jgi:NADPH-dependent 2,4-dienoyl-CoA reductase/sulfur reductase-like enzyme
MKSHYQLLIIGGGPAGLAAATIASDAGISCAVLDEQPTLGGQIYRSIETIPEKRANQLGAEYCRGRKLVAEFRKSNAEYYPNTNVWLLNQAREIGVLQNAEASIISADQIIVASGAMERPVPFTGWTLPGVMQAGAGQILFKTAGIVPDKGVVLAGSGPLLLLLAWQYLHAGVDIKALLDTTPLMNNITAMHQLPRALLAHHYLSKGIGYQIELKRAGIRMLWGVSELRAEGNDQCERVCFKHLGQQKVIETDLLMTHFGVIPHIWLTESAGCKHEWDSNQQCWRPLHDVWGNTDIQGILVAGDGAGINGARSAEHAGRLAGLEILFKRDIIDQQTRDERGRNDQEAMQHERHIRPFLEKYYHIPKNLLATANNETIVCRCEEITAGEIRQAVREGHDDTNHVKFFTRCGMGACQGRQCNNTVAHIIAAERGESVETIGAYRGRPPVTPLTLAQLAALTQEKAS